MEKELNYKCQTMAAKMSQLVVPYPSTGMFTGVDDVAEKTILASMIGNCPGNVVREMLVSDLQPRLIALGKESRIEYGSPSQIDA